MLKECKDVNDKNINLCKEVNSLKESVEELLFANQQLQIKYDHLRDHNRELMETREDRKFSGCFRRLFRR